jgi:hypothetical protein
MLHFKERELPSWLRRVPPVGKQVESTASSGAKRPPGSSCAVRMALCSPCPGCGRTFPCQCCRSLRRQRSGSRFSWPPRRSWSLFGLCGIVRTSNALPAREGKEGWMIRVLAQMLLRQVGAPKGVRLDEADRSPSLHPGNQETTSVRHPRPSPAVSAPDHVAAAEGRWPEPPFPAVVVLFTALAQHRVQAARSRGGMP